MHKLRQGANVETAEECYMISIKKKKSLGYSLVCVVSIYPCRINYSLVCVVSIPVEYSLVCMVSIPVEYSVIIWSAS